MDKLYLAGPTEEHKHDGEDPYHIGYFRRVAHDLELHGYRIIFPVIGSPHPGNRKAYLRIGLLSLLKDADCVGVLPGWEYDFVSQLQVTVARGIGLPVYDAETLELVIDPDSIRTERYKASISGFDPGHPERDRQAETILYHGANRWGKTEIKRRFAVDGVPPLEAAENLRWIFTGKSGQTREGKPAEPPTE